jgi:hypothetical protein
MLRIAIGETGFLSSISRDGELLPVVQANIKMSVQEETALHLVFQEFDGELVKQRDEVIWFSQEEMEFVIVR